MPHLKGVMELSHVYEAKYVEAILLSVSGIEVHAGCDKTVGSISYRQLRH